MESLVTAESIFSLLKFSDIDFFLYIGNYFLDSSDIFHFLQEAWLKIIFQIGLDISIIIIICKIYLFTYKISQPS